MSWPNTTFDDYTLGPLNGQDGWTSNGNVISSSKHYNGGSDYVFGGDLNGRYLERTVSQDGSIVYTWACYTGDEIIRFYVNNVLIRQHSGGFLSETTEEAYNLSSGDVIKWTIETYEDDAYLDDIIFTASGGGGGGGGNSKNILLLGVG